MKKRLSLLRWVTLLMLSSSVCYGQDDTARIQELFAKAEKAPAVQYETVGTSYVVGKTQPMSAPSAKIWQKGPYKKMEMSTPTGVIGGTMIVRPEGTYVYDAGKDRYIKQPGPAMTSQTLVEMSKKNKNLKLKIVGDGVIDGKKCVIVNAVAGGAEGSFNSKHWIWKDNGLTVRVESTMKMGPTLVKMQTDNKNFVFGDIPDSVFAVPKDKIIDNSAGVQK